VPDARAEFDPARPNRACDDGIEGPPTETQTDAWRRTRLGARNGLQWAAHLDRLHILVLDRLDQLHSLVGSETSQYSRASLSLPHRSSLEVGAGPNWQRNAPPSCARLAACRAPCPATQAPPNPAGPRQSGRAPAPVARAARAALPSSKQGPASRDGPRCPISPRVFARAPPADGILGAAKRTASLTSTPILVHSAALFWGGSIFIDQGPLNETRPSSSIDAEPPPECRAHATRFGQRRPPIRFACLDWIGCSQWQGSAAACSRLQHVPSAAGSLTGGTRLQHSAYGCNTVCCCVTLVLRRGRCPGGQQWWHRCGRGMDSVAWQMWAGMASFAGQRWAMSIIPNADAAV